jgi:hypothetical protein
MSRSSRWLFVLAALVCVAAPFVVHATITAESTGLQAAGTSAGLASMCADSASACVALFVGKIISIVIGFSGIVLVGYFLYSGFLWMTSGGDDKQAKQARTSLTNAVVGLVIVTASFAMANFVISQLSTAFGGATGGAGEIAGNIGGAAGGAAETAGAGSTLPTCCFATSTTCLITCRAEPVKYGVPATVDTGSEINTQCTDLCARRWSCDNFPTPKPEECATQSGSTAGGGSPPLCSDLLNASASSNECITCLTATLRQLCDHQPYNPAHRPTGRATDFLQLYIDANGNPLPGTDGIDFMDDDRRCTALYRIRAAPVPGCRDICASTCNPETTTDCGTREVDPFRTGPGPTPRFKGVLYDACFAPPGHVQAPEAHF